MTTLEEQVDAILAAAVSHAAASGWFERVNQHEPKNAPGLGLTAAVWVDRLSPVPARSGLNATSIRLALFVRLFTSMLSNPLDAIDPNLTKATSALIGAYSGDFTLGGLISNVDLLGAHGPGLSGQAGYVDIDTRKFRVMTITVPLIVNDTWSQSP